MSSLNLFKPRPAQYVENGHSSAVRSGAAFLFDAEIPALVPSGVAVVRFLTGDKAILFEGGNVTINQEEVLFEVNEDVIFSAPGTPNLNYARNMNRIINRSTKILFYDTPTISNSGEKVLHQLIKGNAGQNINQPGFGSGAQDASTLLKPNTEHIFRVTNNSALTVEIEAHFFYREVNPKAYT